MEPILKSVIVQRFRSLPAETVTFDNPTFLVGRNGSGKSNFRDAIDFMAEAMSSPLQSVFDRRGGVAVVRNRTSGRACPRLPALEKIDELVHAICGVTPEEIKLVKGAAK